MIVGWNHRRIRCLVFLDLFLHLPDLHRFHLLQLNLGIQLRRVRRLNPPLHRQVKSGIVAARDQGKDYNQQHYFLCFC